VTTPNLDKTKDMFGTIRKHQTWLWVIIIALTVISFVSFGPSGWLNPKIERAMGSEGYFGVMGGRPITREELMNARNEVALDTFFKKQQFPDMNSPEAARQAYLRLFLIHKQKDLGIRVSTEAAADLGRSALHNLGASSLDELNEKLLKPNGMDLSDFDRFLRHYLGMEQMMMSAGVSGKLVTPQEAETMYKLENQAVASSLVYFSASNYLAKVPVSPELIGQFYSNQLANYRVPEQVQVNYVKYNVTNYFPSTIATLTNLDELVDVNVRQLGTNLFHGARTPEESKANLRMEIIRKHAIVDAHKAASAFAVVLYDMKPLGADNLAKLAASSNLTMRATAPFDREYGPQDIVVPPAFTQKAFGLSADDPFAGPIVADDGVYVIALKDRSKSETPSLAKIEDKVTADFRFMNGVEMAKQAAMRFNSTLTNGLASGKAFSSLCVLGGVNPEPLPPMSLNTRNLPQEIENRINFNLLRQVVFSTPPGQCSSAAGSRDGAFIVYVEKQLPLDEAKLKADLPSFTTYVRTMRLNDAFNLWFNSQIRADPDFLQFLQRMSEETQMKSASARRAKS